MAAGFQHPKVNLVIGDGFEYLSKNKGSYDVIITDSSDPVGPAEALFSETFYGLMHNALAPNGIICTQGECQWLHLPLIKKVMDASKLHYPVVSYAWTSIPTYPSGQIGFILCSTNPSTVFSIPLRSFSKETEKASLKYYNSQVHQSAFILPQFAKNVLENE